METRPIDPELIAKAARAAAAIFKNPDLDTEIEEGMDYFDPEGPDDSDPKLDTTHVSGEEWEVSEGEGSEMSEDILEPETLSEFTTLPERPRKRKQEETADTGKVEIELESAFKSLCEENREDVKILLIADLLYSLFDNSGNVDLTSQITESNSNYEIKINIKKTGLFRKRRFLAADDVELPSSRASSSNQSEKSTEETNSLNNDNFETEYTSELVFRTMTQGRYRCTPSTLGSYEEFKREIQEGGSAETFVKKILTKRHCARWVKLFLYKRLF